MLVVDVMLAALAGVLGAGQAASSPVGIAPATLAPLIAAVVALALVVRRRFRVPALVVSIGATVCSGMSIPVALAIATLGWKRGNRRTTWLWAAAACVAVMVPWKSDWDRTDLEFGALIGFAMVGLPLAIGLWLAQRRELMVSLHERADSAERERDLRVDVAVADERIRIARELHDIVAHRISQITVTAGALEVAPHGNARESAEVIRHSATAALSEMREMLGVLRDPDAAPLRPAPDLEGVRTLVERATAAGQLIEHSFPTEFPQVSGAIGRAVYRLVQEALTNAAKHATGAPVYVRIKDMHTRLEVLVRNEPPDTLRTNTTGSGLGLVGMRERVTLAGGTLVAEPTSAGGFCVRAEFPRRAQ